MKNKEALMKLFQENSGQKIYKSSTTEKQIDDTENKNKKMMI